MIRFYKSEVLSLNSKFQNFKSEFHDIKTDLILADLQKVRLIQKLELMIRLCTFVTCNKIPTDDKKYDHEAYDMKTSLFSRYVFGLYRLQEPYGNLTDFEIILTGELTKTFRLTKILREMI